MADPKSHDAHHGADHAEADHGHAQGHGGKHKPHEHDAGPGTPPWLISFGDMMTLFLCFFIMLVTMASRQDAGLVAGGLGPFVAALENRGMDLPLEGAERLQAINTYRERFGLPKLTDPDQLLGAAEVASASDIERIVKSALRSYSELRQPRVATFGKASADLSEDARRYLDLLADTLRPGRGQVLVLEGRGGADDGDVDRAVLAAARAHAVKAYLLAEHGFVPQRVEARAFAIETGAPAPAGMVDARLIQPEKGPEQ